MMTLIIDDDYELSWTQLRESMEHDEALRSQLMVDKGNVDELRRELLRVERADLAGGLDAIAGDWSSIRWRLASIVLLERVTDLDGFCTAAHGAMAGDTEAIKQLVELLKGVDEEERAHWEAEIAKADRKSPETVVQPNSSVESSEEAEAWCERGEDYFYGRNGVAQDDAKAVEWLRKAAKQGHADAQSNLGWMYQEGRGVSQSDTEAVKWYRKAAKQGHADAQFNLGWMYQKGRGVSQSDTMAAKWYRKAAEQGDKDARKALRKLGL